MPQKNNSNLHGYKIYKYVEMDISRVNDILKALGCERAKILGKDEETSEMCICSVIAEDDTTPFIITLGTALGVSVRDYRWLSRFSVGVCFE